MDQFLDENICTRDYWRRQHVKGVGAYSGVKINKTESFLCFLFREE